MFNKYKKSWPKHRDFVRSHPCCVPDCGTFPVDVAHLRTAANSGIGIKPADWFVVGLCRRHHREQHDIGQKRFENKYDINLMALAKIYVDFTPDFEMVSEYIKTHIAN